MVEHRWPQLCALAGPDVDAAAALLAEAMLDNPTHVAVFGPQPALRQRRLRRFFMTLLPWVLQRGSLIGVHEQDQLLGVMGMLPVGSCKPDHKQMLNLGLRWARSFPPPLCWRLARWLLSWRRLDPVQEHFHLGPLAVKPAWQGQGIGSRLFAEGCRRMDACSAAGWLETDLRVNVALYQRFGFNLVAQHSILGVPNFFMWRDSRSPPAAD